MQRDGNDDTKLVVGSSSTEACMLMFQKLQDGLLPQADVLDTRVFSTHIRIRYRRWYLQSLAPTFLCYVRKQKDTTTIALYYKEGVTLVTWTLIAVMACCVYVMIYIFAQYNAGLTAILIGLAGAIALLRAIFAYEGKLQATIKEVMYQKIKEVVDHA